MGLSFFLPLFFIDLLEDVPGGRRRGRGGAIEALSPISLTLSLTFSLNNIMIDAFNLAARCLMPSELCV